MEHSLPIQNQSDIIISIDKRLAQLEQERSEIERKYGIDDNVLNSFSFSNITELHVHLFINHCCFFIMNHVGIVH